MIDLLPYQEEPATRLLSLSYQERVSVNASDTGTGKTYMGLHVVEQRHEAPFLVVCPKPTVPNWKHLIHHFGLNRSCLDVINIEKLKGGRTKWLKRPDKNNPKTYQWVLPDHTFLLIDEAHQYGGQDSQNAYALAYLSVMSKIHIHLMSATLADSPARFRAFGFLMGLHDFVHFDRWAIEHGCFRDEYNNLRFTRVPTHQFNPMLKLHQAIFPRFGIRLRIVDIPDFPRNTLVPVLVALNPTPAYEKKVEAYMKSLKDEEIEVEHWSESPVNSKTDQNTMVVLLRERQRIELMKLPWLAEQIKQCVEEEERSAAVFLNFKESIRWLQTMIPPSVAVTGDHSSKDRENSRNLFQDNRIHVLIATHGAGGTGIDLHDLKGRPRTSFISPCFAPVQFTQTLGRIHRAGGLSPSIQNIICMEDTIEEMVLTRLENKLQNLSTLNDGDLLPENE